MSYPIDNFKKRKCYRKCVYCIVLLNNGLKKQQQPCLCIMVGISVGQISILFFLWSTFKKLRI